MIKVARVVACGAPLRVASGDGSRNHHLKGPTSSRPPPFVSDGSRRYGWQKKNPKPEARTRKIRT